MAVTRLKRKEKRNKSVSKARTASIKFLTKTPVIKKVDIEELRKQQGSSVQGSSVIDKVKDKVEEVAKAVKKAVNKDEE
jgi:hypothetical protein